MSERGFEHGPFFNTEGYVACHLCPWQRQFRAGRITTTTGRARHDVGPIHGRKQ